MQKRKLKLAFSLIELSIVILIIGILVIGISKGSRIIRASKLKTAGSLTTSSPVSSMDGILMWVESTLDKSFVTGEAIDTPFGATGTITTWNDINPQTVTPNSPNQSTGSNKPRYISNGINGLPILNFDGVSDYFSYNGSVLVNTNYTIFVVEQRRSNAANVFLGGQDSINNGNLILGYTDNVTLAFSQYGPFFSVGVNGYVSPTPRIHSYRFSSTLGKNYYINGALTTFVLVGSPNPLDKLISNNLPAIGRFAAASAFYNGDIGEIIMFNRYLKDSERSSIETYLKSKWGIK